MGTMALNAVPALARMSGIDNPRNRGASRKTTLNITVGAIIAPRVAVPRIALMGTLSLRYAYMNLLTITIPPLAASRADAT